MDTSTLDFNTLTLLVAIVGSTIGSTLTIVSLMFRQFNRHEESINALSTNIAVLDTKVTALESKVDVMGRDVSDSRERLARVEGHLLAPEGFTLRHPGQRDAGEPPSGDPAPDHREAG